MKPRLSVLVLLLMAAAVTVHGLSSRSAHQFRDSECVLCHFDSKDNPKSLKPTLTIACSTCHLKQVQKKSHPSDVYPSMAIPHDMPLSEGKLTCLTCHYVHGKDSIEYLGDDQHFLRRQVRGVFFCTICHTIDKERHLVYENVHVGTYSVTDRTSRIDRISLECIECHDTHMKDREGFPGPGVWYHYRKEFNHPIGVSYKRLTARKVNTFRPQELISEDVMLYDGKIGCGTCHNIYSREKNMLAVDNTRSRLCLECHIK